MKDTIGVLLCPRGEAIGQHSTVGAKNAPSEPPLIRA